MAMPSNASAKPLETAQNWSKSVPKQSKRPLYPNRISQVAVNSCKSMCMMLNDLPNHYGITDF